MILELQNWKSTLLTLLSEATKCDEAKSPQKMDYVAILGSAVTKTILLLTCKNITLSCYTPSRRKGEAQIKLYPSSNPALKSSLWSAPRSGRFTPKKEALSTAHAAGWASEPF
jgi:hypothetical protein